MSGATCGLKQINVVSIQNDSNPGGLIDLSLLFMQKGSEGWVYSECRGKLLCCSFDEGQTVLKNSRLTPKAMVGMACGVLVAFSSSIQSHWLDVRELSYLKSPAF